MLTLQVCRAPRWLPSSPHYLWEFLSSLHCQAPSDMWEIILQSSCLYRPSFLYTLWPPSISLSIYREQDFQQFWFLPGHKSSLWQEAWEWGCLRNIGQAQMNITANYSITRIESKFQVEKRVLHKKTKIYWIAKLAMLSPWLELENIFMHTSALLCDFSPACLAALGQDRRKHTVGCLMGWDRILPETWQKDKGAKETRVLARDWLEKGTV